MIGKLLKMRQVARSSSQTFVQKTEAWIGERCWLRCGLLLWIYRTSLSCFLGKVELVGMHLIQNASDMANLFDSSWSLTSHFPDGPPFFLALFSLLLSIFFFSPLSFPILIGKVSGSDQETDTILPWWPAGPAVMCWCCPRLTWALVKLLAGMQCLFHLCRTPLGIAFFRHLYHLGLLRSLCAHSQGGSGYTCWEGCNQMNGWLIATIRLKSFCQERGNSEENCEH